MNYYNDNDPKACAWARELIKLGLVPDGEVDNRPIQQVQSSDLRGFIQCHFFSGILGWSLALKLAGWSADRPVWTGSCPCQPFSAAGKGLGAADERHLWPAFFNLIRECRPNTVFGEQVAGAIGHGWLDDVSTDLEREGYACGATVLGAHSVRAPHRRQRLYWVGHSSGARRCGREKMGNWGFKEFRGSSPDGAVADPDGIGEERPRPEEQIADAGRTFDNAVADATGQQKYQKQFRPEDDEGRRNADMSGGCGMDDFWSDAEPIACTDGKQRLVKSGIQPLVAGLPRGVVPSGNPSVSYSQASEEFRVARLHGYGNAIVPQVAAEFILAAMTAI